MDNIQDTVQAAPQGQTAPVEQIPDVQSSEATQVSNDSVQSESSESSNETSFEAIAAKKGFKNPDDLARAYANLESQNTKVSMKNADLERSFFPEAKREALQPQPQPRTLNEEEQRALSELRSFVHKEAVEPLEARFDARLKEELAKIELRSVIKDNPDFGKYADEIKTLKSKYPDMPFSEALTYSKAMKGDLVRDAKAEGLKEGTWFAQKQAAAQVAPQRKTAEEKIAANDLLAGASSRWSIRQNTSPEAKARIRAEQALVEREIFGESLKGI